MTEHTPGFTLEEDIIQVRRFVYNNADFGDPVRERVDRIVVRARATPDLLEAAEAVTAAMDHAGRLLPSNSGAVQLRKAIRKARGNDGSFTVGISG